MRYDLKSNTLQPAIGLAVGIGILGAAAGYAVSRVRGRRGNSDDAPGRTARGLSRFGDYDVVGRTVTIARPRKEVFAYWRDFQNLPRFMENVEGVQPTGADGQAVWSIRWPGKGSLAVETRIVREVEDEVIAWRSVEGSDIDTEGRVEFSDAPGGRGTRVTAIIAYKPPAGRAGKMIAKLFQREPAIQARHDLKRLKMLLEAGEIATSARRVEGTRAAKMKEA